MHATLVPVVQLVVPQSKPYVKTVVVRSALPKLRPLMVTDVPPLRTAFGRIPLATGASNVMALLQVPMTRAIVKA
jgi:hypothetical protein